MTQDPYAQAGGGPGFDQYSGPARTSALAIFSLVLSVLCCTAPLGLICGGAAMILIPRSRGRVGGMGLAVAGTIIGLIATVMLLFAIAGAAAFNAQFAKDLLGPGGAAMRAVETDDLVAARKVFAPALAAQVTEADFAAFRAAYQAETGAFVRMADESLVDWLSAYAQVGQSMQNFNGSNVFPMPAHFDNGMAVVLVALPQTFQQSPAGQMLPPMDNLGVLGPSGTEYWLVPRPSTQPVVPPAVPGAPPAPSVPGTPPQPAPPGEG